MEIHIVLTQDDWTCLSTNIPKDSPLRVLLEAPRSTDLGSGVLTIDCDRDEAERLLEIARKACPHAVHLIQSALTRAGLL
jgi:hypothetical protein